MIILVILDGYGIAEKCEFNAVTSADTPFLDSIRSEYPSRTIFAHGEYVGLPKGQMGNSEVGHLNIGGGRTIRPDLVVINDQIESGKFFKNGPLLDLVSKTGSRGGRIHLMGLLSDGGIHSHINHLEALLRLINENGDMDVFIHPYLDGRDTEPKVADKFIDMTSRIIAPLPSTYIATLGGRSWGMDRDNNWERIKVHYDAIVHGVSDFHSDSAEAAIDEAFGRGETDEFISPTIVDLPGELDGKIRDGDGVIHFNFRADRGIQMTDALSQTGFEKFDTGTRPQIDMVTFTHYSEYQEAGIAFDGDILHDTLTEVVCDAGRTVFKIAETEKWAHVTRFFNGGSTEPLSCEERLLVQSPLDVRPFYDKKPQMSAGEITDEIINRCSGFDLVIVNYANCDMVGHTGNFDAAIEAVETVDRCLKRLHDAFNNETDTIIVIADHGNADQMVDSNGEPHTKHTTNTVPFYIIDRRAKLREGEGSLKDVAPTILYLMGIDKPELMTGTSLVL